MPVNPSIPLQAQPLKLMDPAQMMSLQTLSRQNQLGQLQIEDTMRARDEQEQLRSLFRDPSLVDPKTGTVSLEGLQRAYSVSPKVGMELAKNRQVSLKAIADLDKVQLEAKAAEAKQARDALALVGDQDTFTAWRLEQIARNPRLATAIPEGFDPKWQRQNVMDADKFIAQNTPKIEMKDVGGKIMAVDVNPVTNPAIKGTSLDKTPSPEAALTDKRTREAQAETRRANLERERQAGEAAERADWQYDADRGLLVNKRTGATKPVTAEGAPVSNDAKVSDVERTAAGYANRMTASAEIMRGLEAKGVGKPEASEVAAGLTPGKEARKIAQNVARSPDRQQFHQAQEDWVRAKLRKESGAVIADEEMDREIRTYFPQVGDSAAVIKQKADARRVAEEAMVKSAGRAQVTRPQGEIKAKVEAAGWTYEPAKYEYRIGPGGKIQRKLRG